MIDKNKRNAWLYEWMRRTGCAIVSEPRPRGEGWWAGVCALSNSQVTATVAKWFDARSHDECLTQIYEWAQNQEGES